MDTSLVRPLLRRIYGAVGLVGQIGEPQFDAAMSEVQLALGQIAVELIQAERSGVSMADAVHDPESCPHAAKFHGMVRDLLFVPVPVELEPVVRQMAAFADPGDMGQLLRLVAELTFRHGNLVVRSMARFMMFEILCLTQRMSRIAQGQRLEAMTGAERKVEAEAEAEAEILAAENHAHYQEALLALEQPLRIMVEAAGLEYQRAELHDLLEAALARLPDALEAATPLIEALLLAFDEARERRRECERRIAAVPLSDLVLLMNEAEGGKFTADQLRRLHPLALGGLSDNAIYKRAQRARDGLDDDRADGGPPRRRSGGATLADLLVEQLSRRSLS